MPTTTGLFQKLTSWRHGAVRSAGGIAADQKIASLESAVIEFDRRGRELERYLERVNQMLNFGMIAGACRDIMGRVNSVGPLVVNSGVPTDVPSATVTFTPDYDVKCHINAVLDVVQTVVGGGSVLVGEIVVDGAVQLPQLIMNMNGAVALTLRMTCAQNCVVSLTGKVAHTIKIRAWLNPLGSTYQINGQHTGFTYHCVPVPPF